jgi:hypothetical protein
MSSSLKKNILVIYFTQSGQLREILDSIFSPFQGKDGMTIHHQIIQPEKPYPFPWGRYTFYDVFPESVFEIPCRILPLKVDSSVSYDLVVLAYQPWFLSPSIPISSFLQSSEGKMLLNGKEVITVIGCRNLWLSAQESVKERIKEAGGKLVGNIALSDHSPFLSSVVTILYWMLTGKRDRYLGIFPRPGVQQKEVDHASLFGGIILDYLGSPTPVNLQEGLVKVGAVEVKPHYMSLEKRGKKIFGLWAGFALKKGGPGNPARKWRIKAFSYYLPTVIFLLSPLVFILTTLVNSLSPSKVRKEKAYYNGVGLDKPD